MDAPLVVVGGGPVGSTLGLMVPGSLVLEAGSFPRDKPCGEGLLPAGVEVLGGAGVDLEVAGCPAIRGIQYRAPGAPVARATLSGTPGRGVRRLRFDSLLAARAGVRSGCRVLGLREGPSGVEVRTEEGVLGAEAVVVAAGMGSPLVRQLGWGRPRGGAQRFGLVGHLETEGGDGDIVVTLLRSFETYLAPVGEREVLVAVLGSRGALSSGPGGREARYRRLLAASHPELAGALISGPVRGAGPFPRPVAQVASGRIFLAGDASGFLDPLTGDGITAGLQQAEFLARALADDLPSAAARYRRWHRAQWRRRWLVGYLARQLSGHPSLTQRALGGLASRPLALERLIMVSQGTSGWGALGVADWAALLNWGQR
ncbi:MAG: NAD(P)/FAD-dependent oxidoreductase [Candidatus Dormibacteraeota bacterium]|nr:NAD(P)/FAD-dependent oxidoreductase [Candidatus Dormibacteraeota bacterium]